MPQNSSFQGIVLICLDWENKIPQLVRLKHWRFSFSHFSVRGCCCQVASVISDSVRPHRWQPIMLPHLWDSPGKNPGVGCHFLLYCMTAKSESRSVVFDSLWPHGLKPTSLLHPWDFPGKNTVLVAISFSNAWKWKVKVKSLSQVWFSDPMDCSLPGSSVHGIFQARVLEWGAIAFSEIYS